MKKITLLAVIILLSISGLVQAEPGELSGSLNVTYLSSYIWRGFDYYADDRSAIQGSINLDLYGTGFDLGILSRRAISNDYENAENLNVTLSYSNSVISNVLKQNEKNALFLAGGTHHNNVKNNRCEKNSEIGV